MSECHLLLRCYELTSMQYIQWRPRQYSAAAKPGI